MFKILKEKILITGACGQLGSVLTKALQIRFGTDCVIASDLEKNAHFVGCFEKLDATDFNAIQAVVVKYRITQIYHLAAILSAKGEMNLSSTWDINMGTFFNVLKVSRIENVQKVFFPSSIAVFGSKSQSTCVSQFSNLTPSTVYGISKVAAENWSNYYFEKFGLDIRSIRFPGIIGYQSLPGGGTTDYAIEMFHRALNRQNFECYLNAATTLPMIYMDDAVRATLELMEAPIENITVRTSYNIAGMSFNPKELATFIQQAYPDFKITYKTDFRQKIADSWPQSIDDAAARTDWSWKPRFNLESMTSDMIKNLRLKYLQN